MKLWSRDITSRLQQGDRVAVELLGGRRTVGVVRKVSECRAWVNFDVGHGATMSGVFPTRFSTTVPMPVPGTLA